MNQYFGIFAVTAVIGSIIFNFLISGARKQLEKKDEQDYKIPEDNPEQFLDE